MLLNSVPKLFWCLNLSSICSSAIKDVIVSYLIQLFNLKYYCNGPAETVIYRIFYYINRSGNGQLTLRELKRGNLIDAMQHADEEEDINKVLRYTN